MKPPHPLHPITLFLIGQNYIIEEDNFPDIQVVFSLMKLKIKLSHNPKLFMAVLAVMLLLLPVDFPDAAAPYRIRTVVIDPGHGGHDAGCLGASAKEKHIALDIALKLGKHIETNYPEVKVIYTRTKDVFVELHERAAIANRAKADLFICIHANASESLSAFGTETYVMGLHKTAENLAVARRENSAILYEKDYKTRYDGYDPNSPEAHIIFNLFQKAYMEQSLLFAAKIQNEFEEYAGRFNRGVKQAGFLVLYRTAMPAVLIETGFLSNRAEEKYLLSEKGQNDIAVSIYRAFTSYKIDMESSGGDLMNDKPAAPPIRKDTIKSEAKRDTSGTVIKKPEPLQEEKKDTAKTDVKKPEPKQEPKPVKEVELKMYAADSLKPVKETLPPVEKPKAEIKKSEPAKNEESEFFYTVQIGAVPAGSATNTSRFDEVNAVAIKGEDGYTRYAVGRFTKLSEAMAKQSELRNKGFKDAFVTPYFKGKRISLKEAAALGK